MKVVISRRYSDTETSGQGVVFDDDAIVYEFKTLELPELGNQKRISCIPEGKYEVHKITSPTKGKCFQVMDVKGRTAILIHIGNYATGVKVDTQGCILVGTTFTDMNKDGYIDVAESTIALTKLREILPGAFNLHII
jgi:hypothetical protein